VRRPEEVLLVVHRPGAAGREFLVVLRAPDRGGFWHLVGGGIEDDETPEAAGRRELAEETGLDAPVNLEVLPLRLGYHNGKERIAVHFCAVEAAPEWEPVLDDEHDDHRWLPAADALEVVRYPEPRQGLQAVADLLGDAG
jgi:8-oxo-dGTP diphosphatase